LLAALFDAKDVEQAAADFHLALADGLAGWLIVAAREQQTRVACLGGGCFHNRILRERILTRLDQAGLRVCLPSVMGCGDAGLAIGQAWIAARQQAAISDNAPAEETMSCA
jgi:hydrogenase maturation protein HypF